MPKQWSLCLLVLLAFSSNAWGWLHIFPEKDLRSMPGYSFIGGDIEGYVEDGPLPAPSYGYMVNSAAYYFFNGDTATLNRWLAKEAIGLENVRTDKTVAKVVIHTGVGEYKSPANVDQIVRRADWSLAHIPSVRLADGDKKLVHSLDVKIHVWVGDKVRLDALKIPKEFEVESGGEIERFIRNRSATETSDATRQTPWWEG